MSEKELLERAARGDNDALGQLLAMHEPRLSRMIRARLSPQLLGRLGVSDVIQEVRVEALGRFAGYAQRPDMPFFLWLRFLTFQHIAAVYRRNFGTQRRDVRREIRFDPRGRSTANPDAMAAQLAAGVTSPSHAAMRLETERRLRDALANLDEMDREVLSLRHFEQLTNVEVANELGIDTSAASKRYVRALARLRATMDELGITAE